WAEAQRGENLGEGCSNGALRLPRIHVRPPLLPTERQPVPGSKSIREKCQACEAEGRRGVGARQYEAMAGSTRSAEQTTARLVGLFLLWITWPGIQSG